VEGFWNGSESDIAGSSTGIAAGLPDAALDLLCPNPEVGVAGVYLTPGVDDRDHGFAAVIVRGVSYLLGARAVPEGAQVLHPAPAVAAQIFGTSLPVHQNLPFLGVDRLRSSRTEVRSATPLA